MGNMPEVILSNGELTSTEKLIMFALMVKTNGTKKAIPYEEIAEMCSLGRTTVIRFVKSLETKGFITISRSNGRRETNVYQLIS
ncbi:helix-turn-helix domain-containing protein [Bacillus mycoides]|uniref:helix-turn-helix domain-containing protein n=1 Tax=Bacillus mycoides TaxID=1405 RepID=UPI003D65C556